MRTITDDQVLTPLERLHLREALQDLWREQLRLITVLSLAQYDEPDAASAPTTKALDAARARLAEVEQVMRRLDEPGYGRCVHCGLGVGFDVLVLAPDAATCPACRPARAS